MKLEKCKNCSGDCCKLMYIQINKEKSEKDYIRWVNLHENIQVVKRKGYWYMKIDLKCSKLKNGKCSIYKDRPKLCKEYDCTDPNFIGV